MPNRLNIALYLSHGAEISWEGIKLGIIAEHLVTTLLGTEVCIVMSHLPSNATDQLRGIDGEPVLKPLAD